MASDGTTARVLGRLQSARVRAEAAPTAAAPERGPAYGAVSGQQIADELGVSRNAVWKAVAALRDAGYVIDGEPRVGYRLVASPDALEPDRIAAALSSSFYPSIEYVPETDSTNSDAKARARAGAPEGTVVVADRQRRGRGRRGRPWETGFGESLLFSVVLRPDIPPRQAPLLVFLAAAAVRRALLPLGNTFIKWPNDVVTEEGRKVSGILVELDADHDRVRHAVVGVGVNVRQRRRDFPPAVRDAAASASELAGRPVLRGPLLARLLDELALSYEGALRDGFAAVLAETRRHSATLGRPVLVRGDGGEPWSGVAADVQGDGALLVRPEGPASRPVPVYAAEVSIRMEARASASQ